MNFTDEPTREDKVFRYYANIADVDYLYTLYEKEKGGIEAAQGAVDAFSNEAMIAIPTLQPVGHGSPRNHSDDLVICTVRSGHHLFAGQSDLEAMDAVYECPGCGRLPRQGCKCP